jgi:[ribosomal protein S5]-alanine N-acetyltransferase
MRPARLIEPQRIETERLILRPLTTEDSEGLFRIFSDPEVTRYLEITPLKFASEGKALLEYFNGQFERKSGVRWGIERKQDGALLGTCGFHSVELWVFKAELSYDIGRPYWGKGIVPEAAKALLQHAFGEMGMNRVQASVLPEAAASAKVLEKLGFHREGVLRETGYWKGRFWDKVTYSLLKREWEEREGAAGGLEASRARTDVVQTVTGPRATI